MSYSTGQASVFNALKKSSISSTKSDTPLVFYARVLFVLRDDSDKEKYAKLKGIKGSIECHRVVDNVELKEIIDAYPSSGNHKKYPIENEIVKIEVGPSPFNQDNAFDKLTINYYTDIVGTWNSVEHNVVPFQNEIEVNKPGINSYKDSEKGLNKNINNAEDSSTGSTFKETGKLRSLEHAPGDMTYEGRFGNSIRFGNSHSSTDTPWKGEDNSPITIIRNGQKQVENHDKNNIFEDINLDGSSIWMLSGHSTDFIPSVNNFDSYHETVKISQPNNVIVPTTPIIETPVESSSKGEELNKIPAKEEKPAVAPPQNVTQAQEPVIEDELDSLPDSEYEAEFTEIFEDVKIIQPESSVNKLTGFIELNTYVPEKRSESRSNNSSGIKSNFNKIKSYIDTMISKYPILKNDKNGKNKIRALLTIIANETGESFAPLTEDLTYKYRGAKNIFSAMSGISESDFINKFGGNPVKNQKAFGNFVYGTGRQQKQLGNRVGTDDGFNFRGRGLFQITGRDSYSSLSVKLNKIDKSLCPTPDFFVQNYNLVNDERYVFKIFMAAFFEGGICSKGYSVIKGEGSKKEYRSLQDTLNLINSGLKPGNEVYNSYSKKFSIVYGNELITKYLDSVIK